MGGASTTTARASRGLRTKPRAVASMRASAATSARKRPISTRSRARCDSLGRRAPNAQRDQGLPIDIAGPRLGERARQREQHRPARQRPPRGAGAQAATAGVDHQRARGQERCDLVEAQRLLAAGEEAPGGGTIERGPRLRHLGQERRHACAIGRLVRAGERRPRRADAQRAQRQLGRGQLGHRRQRRRQAARIEACQRGRGLVEAAEQQEPARRDQPRLQRVGAIGARLERGRRRRQRARRAAEVAHGQRHLGLGDDAARARQLLVRAEAARGAPQKLARARVLAELGHGDAAQGQRRRVVAQRDPLEGAERVAGGEGARGGGDQGVHDDRLLRRADFATRLLLPGCGRARGPFVTAPRRRRSH